MYLFRRHESEIILAITCIACGDSSQILNMTPAVCFAMLQVDMDTMARFIRIGLTVERAAGFDPLLTPVKLVTGAD